MENQQPKLEYKISDDKTSITLSIGDAKLSFSAQQFENMIGNMGFTREMMEPPVRFNLEDNGLSIPLDGVNFRQVVVNGVPTKDGAALVVRSAKFGWFGYQLDPQFCQGLISWLSGRNAEISAPAGASLN
jgi:hypothetical protein